jgi:hypothetical protein
VLYLRLIILSVGGDVSIDSDVLMVIDFMNLKIKLTQSFGYAHRDRVCVRVFIEMSTHTCMSNVLCLSKKTLVVSPFFYIGSYIRKENASNKK